MRRPLALVTGASAGIGLAFARELAARGYDLAVVARRRDRLDALAADVVAAHPGARVSVIVADLADPAGAAAVAADVQRLDAVVELLVNNAGFGWHGAFIDMDAANAAGQIAVNVTALVALTRAILPGMVARRRGGVINVASTAAFQPVPLMAVYAATKAFVLSFSEALHEEVRDAGVRIVALCPGATPTEFESVAGMSMTNVPQRSVADVVRTALHALERNEAVAVDGPVNVAMVTGARLMPRGVVRRIAGTIGRRMGKSPA